MLRPRPEIIPDTLTAIPRWVAWKLETRDGKPTKVPYTPRDDERALSKASSTDPATWRDFPTSLHTLEHDATVSGIGFALNGDGLCGVDFDHCRDPDTGEINARVTRFLEMLDSYTEVSPSGTGVRVFVHGELPEGPRKNTKEGIEMYADGRYLTVTGHHLEAYPVDVREAQAALETMHAELFPAPVKPVAAAPRAISSVSLDDHALLEQARDAKNGAKFSRLYSGDFEGAGYSSQSEADLALCGSLHFWTGGDMARVDTLFQLSGLMRPKWDKRHSSDGQTYGQMTLERVASDGGNVYTGEFGVTRGGVNAASSDADGFTWGQLGELAPALPSAASLPADMIPAALREWLEGAAAAACVPLEVLTVPALIAASGVIGRTVTIHPRDFSNWTVAPNLWGAIVAPPGTMKSDMMGEALRPVSALEKTAREAHRAAKLEADVEHDQLEAEYSGLKQKAKKGGGDKNAMLEIKQRLADLENVPRKRYTTSDATCEKLGELLCDNQRGMILTRDELASWISSMEREENHTARGFFLTSWNGTSPYTFDRIGRGTVDIPAMCVSVLGAIQPLPLRAVFSRLQEDETRADGLMQRFQLFVYPDGLPAWKAPRSWPNPDARNVALEVFKRLDTLERYDAETGDLEPRELRFSSDAQTVFDDWHDALEHRLRGAEDAKTPHFHSHISKYRSLAPSLAVVFHLLEAAAHPDWRDWGQLEPVSLDALELALCWVEFLELHARKIYAPELNLSSVAAHALSKRIRDGSVTDAMTVRSLRRRDWSGLRGAALDAALTELEALNWVRLETVEARGDQGGAPSEIVRLHPNLLRGGA